MEQTYSDDSGLGKILETEITDYTTKNISRGDNINYSQHKLVRRITLFENQTYPTGKFDKQGRYKAWYEIITPRIDSEVKNIDFDTKNIEAWSPRIIDDTANIITNLKLGEYLRDTGQAEEFNSAIEEGAGWGNIVWKKIKGTYERCDLRNLYVINQTARTLDDSPVIERHQLSQTDLRAKTKNYKYIKEVINTCGQKSYKGDQDSTDNDSTSPYYNIYERNGEVCLKNLKIYRGEQCEDGDEDKYVLAKIVGAGTEGTKGGIKINYIMYAQQISKMPYKEYHRGRYKGVWFREGLYQLLFDIQVRCNELGNQISQGLEWASKIVFSTPDKLIINNIITDLKNGDIIKTSGLTQVNTRMGAIDQLIAEYNRLIQMADFLANSQEIIQGVTPASGVPLGTSQLANQNAGKLYDFIREKLSIPFREIFEEWIIPELITDIKAEEVLRLTGDSDMLKRLQQMIVDNWYIDNLIAIGPHSPELGETLKLGKMKELQDKKVFIKEFKDMFEDYKPRVSVVITGENVDIPAQLDTLSTFISLETDPVRRSYLVEKAMKLKRLDVGSLPRSTPEQLAGVRPEQPPRKDQPAPVA